MADYGVLNWAGLEISFQRLGRVAWSADGIVRSWAQAPWSRLSADEIAVASLPDEALWLGLNATGAAVRVRLRSRGGRWQRELKVPPDWQLAWLAESAAGGAAEGAADGGRRQPIALRRGCRSASYVLEVRRRATAAARVMALRLLAPDAWRRMIGPLQIAPAEEPEEVMLYSRIMPAGPPPRRAR